MKFFFLFVTCLAVLCVKVANAQDELSKGRLAATKKDTKLLDIISLEGKNVKVKITPDYTNSILRMTCLKDTIEIADFWKEQPEIQVLNKNFIEIKYAVRGGSGLGLGNTLILCVNNSRLFEAMHVLRFREGDSGDIKNDYHIRYSLIGNSKNDYKLKVNIHDDYYSKYHTENNYSYDNQTTLTFDKKQNVFYSVKKYVYNHFIMSGKGKKIIVEGHYPLVILGAERYYCINRRWHHLMDAKEFYEF